MLKLKTAQDLGFRTLVVWESEYKQDKELTIQEVCKWTLKESK
jgi:G:T-mismatch repair DNA endonuclease (very short patch repair protein)